MTQRDLYNAGVVVFYAAIIVCLVLVAAGVTGSSSSSAASTTVEGRYRGVTASVWAHRYRARTDDYHRVKRVLRADGDVRAAIGLACVVYGHCDELERKAFCETGGTMNPRAKNPRSTASGLFQFLDSTWKSTPFAGLSVWDPYANALAAGWMHSVGRGGEWDCR